jgi:hypothetical protein
MTHHGFPCQHNCQHEMMMKDCNHGMQPGFCCPQGMEKGMCSKKPGCMPHDSMMKCCAKHMEGDSAKMPVLKK